MAQREGFEYENPLPRAADKDDAPEGADEGNPEERELRQFMEDITTAKNCLRCFNGLLLLLGVGLTVFSFLGGELLLSLNWLAYALSGVGIVLCFVSVLGFLGSTLDIFNRLLLVVRCNRGPRNRQLPLDAGMSDGSTTRCSCS